MGLGVGQCDQGFSLMFLSVNFPKMAAGTPDNRWRAADGVSMLMMCAVGGRVTVITPKSFRCGWVGL